MFNNNHSATIHGILGTATSAGGAVISTMPEFETWLRLGASLIAIISGLVTSCYMIYQMRKK